VSYSVGQVAGSAGVTIRALHHYDEIRLLSPSGRSAAGYRIYEEADLERLQRILFYQELGFTLEEIAAIMDDPRTDAVGHLRRQRGLLIERIERLRTMVAAIDHEMEAQKMGIHLTPEERFEIFGDFRPEDYAEEVEQRWGGTEAYRLVAAARRCLHQGRLAADQGRGGGGARQPCRGLRCGLGAG
jgi:MerR family transcriptional regulator, thiopeptide resistance regulator